MSSTTVATVKATSTNKTGASASTTASNNTIANVVTYNDTISAEDSEIMHIRCLKKCLRMILK